jgi:hypothetical protein
MTSSCSVAEQKMYSDNSVVIAERDYLLQENRRLIGMSEGKKDEVSAEPVNLVKETIVSATSNKQSISGFSNNGGSSSIEKVQLYRSLFRGREDVYAKLWQNKNTLKSGYSPVCKNEWV